MGPITVPSSSQVHGETDQYDQVLIDIVRYVYYTPVNSILAYTRARAALLDALGCAIETLCVSSDCCAIIGPVVPGTTVPNGCRLPGTSHQLDPVKGAFDMGSLIRYLDHNDAYPGAEWGHPSDNLGALVAVADWISRSTSAKKDTTGQLGRTEFSSLKGNHKASLPPINHAPEINLHTLLTAQIKAYEIQGVFQVRNAFNEHGLDHTILVKVASTAVGSWLLGLSESEALAALSQAWQDGHPLRTFRQAPNAGPRKGWAAGDACMRAVHLALLTKAGQPGAATVLSADRWGFQAALFGGKEFVLPRPYGSWVMESVFFKLIPAEGHAISAAEAALQLAQTMKQKDLSPERDIQTITIRTQKAAKTIIDKSGPLRNSADRDHCLQYIVAVVLLKGDMIETVDYMDDSPWATDLRVDVLRQKMTVTEDEDFTHEYHDQKVRSGANGITIQLANGECLDEVVVRFPIGHPGRNDTLDRVREKFRTNMRMMFEEGKAEEVLEAVERDDMPVHEFIDLFVKERERERQS